MNYVMHSPWKLCALALALAFALAACSTATVPDSLTPKDEGISHIANIKVSGTQTQADIEALYGGQVVLFDANAGFAVLGFSESESELSTLTTEANLSLSLDDLTDEDGGITDALASAWSGGTGVWSASAGAWSGGSGVWSGGISLPNQSLTTLDMVGISQAHANAANFGEGIKVAVIDTGLDLDHPAFEGRLAPTSMWVDLLDHDGIPEDEITAGTTGIKYGHGTAVAGIIAQVAPKAQIIPIRALNSDGTGELIDVIYGIWYGIALGADVVNVSVGTDINSATLSMITAYAAQFYQVHVVISAGNEGNSNSLTYPAEYANSIGAENYVMSVGSVNADGSVSSFSNSSSNLEFLAPGENVFSSYPDNQVGYFTGTSFAAPIVSGMVALGLSESTPQAFETLLANASNAVSGSNTGYGIPQANSLLNALP